MASPTGPYNRLYHIKFNGKLAGNSFVYCLVDDVKHHEKDVERHEVSCVVRRRVPVKLAFLGESTGICNIGWIIK